jgi:hypothetical protein
VQGSKRRYLTCVTAGQLISALGQKRTNRLGPKFGFVRYCPKVDITRRIPCRHLTIALASRSGVMPPAQSRSVDDRDDRSGRNIGAALSLPLGERGPDLNLVFPVPRPRGRGQTFLQ